MKGILQNHVNNTNFLHPNDFRRKFELTATFSVGLPGCLYLPWHQSIEVETGMNKEIWVHLILYYL